jgi:hypothetical protein
MSATGVPTTMGTSRVPTTLGTSPDVARSDVGHVTEAAREATREEYFGGARLLLSDARVVYLLLNHARARVIARVFGITGENSALVTLIVLGLAAEAAHRNVSRALGAPTTPHPADALIGSAMLRESAKGIAGTYAAESPMFGTLILLSLAGAVLRPVVGGSIRRVKTSALRAHADFNHRYGHIIRPSHRRP